MERVSAATSARELFRLNEDAIKLKKECIDLRLLPACKGVRKDVIYSDRVIRILEAINIFLTEVFDICKGRYDSIEGYEKLELNTETYFLHKISMPRGLIDEINLLACVIYTYNPSCEPITNNLNEIRGRLEELSISFTMVYLKCRPSLTSHVPLGKHEADSLIIFQRAAKKIIKDGHYSSVRRLTESGSLQEGVDVLGDIVTLIYCYYVISRLSKKLGITQRIKNVLDGIKKYLIEMEPYMFYSQRLSAYEHFAFVEEDPDFKI